jgi:hypothetical protein
MVAKKNTRKYSVRGGGKKNEPSNGNTSATSATSDTSGKRGKSAKRGVLSRLFGTNKANGPNKPNGPNGPELNSDVSYHDKSSGASTLQSIPKVVTNAEVPNAQRSARNRTNYGKSSQGKQTKKRTITITIEGIPVDRIPNGLFNWLKNQPNLMNMKISTKSSNKVQDSKSIQYLIEEDEKKEEDYKTKYYFEHGHKFNYDINNDNLDLDDTKAVWLVRNLRFFVDEQVAEEKSESTLNITVRLYKGNNYTLTYGGYVDYGNDIVEYTKLFSVTVSKKNTKISFEYKNLLDKTPVTSKGQAAAASHGSDSQGQAAAPAPRRKTETHTPAVAVASEEQLYSKGPEAPANRRQTDSMGPSQAVAPAYEKQKLVNVSLITEVETFIKNSKKKLLHHNKELALTNTGINNNQIDKYITELGEKINELEAARNTVKNKEKLNTYIVICEQQISILNRLQNMLQGR